MTLQERYQAYSNKELIRILLQASKYQTEASEAAKKELAKRNIDADTLHSLEKSVQKELDKELQQEREKESKQEEKVLELITFLKKLCPVQSRASIGERLTVLVGLVFLIIYAEPFYYDIKFLYYEFTQSAFFNLATVFTVGNVILYPLTLYLYFKPTKGGWMLMVGILSLDIFQQFNFLITTIYNASDPAIISMNSGSINYFWLVLPIVVYTLLIVILFQKMVWKDFNVTIVHRVLAFIAGILFFMIFISLFVLF